MSEKKAPEKKKLLLSRETVKTLKPKTKIKAGEPGTSDRYNHNQTRARK
jgi:hypothetical protein